VNLRGGDDRFDFATVGAVRNAKQLRVDLGDGDDTAVIRWADDPGAHARAGFTTVVSGGTGADALGFRVGTLTSGAEAVIRADGGAGADALGVQSLAPGRGAKLDVTLRGGAGDDTIGTYSYGDLVAGAAVSYDHAGGAGNDSVSVNAAGQVAGAFSARVEGGAGNDQLALNAVGVTGPTKPRAALSGGDGDDQLVTLANAGAAEVTADGGPGTDSGLLVGGVTARGVEQARAATNYDLHPGPLPAFNPVLPTATLTRASRTVEYYSAGTAQPGEPVVVLLTGFGGTIDDWQTVPGKLAARAQVVAVNRPGYGKSSAAAGDYALETVEDVRAVLKAVAAGRSAVLVGHSLGGLYANLFARLHPGEVAGTVFVDATAPEVVARIEAAGIPFGGLGDPNAAALRLEAVGVRQEVEGVESLARRVLAAGAFPKVPVVSLRAGPPDLLADDPQADAWYEALGALGMPGETRRVADAGHNIQYDRPDAVVTAVADVRRLARAGRLADQLDAIRTKAQLPALAGGFVSGGRVTVAATGVRANGNPTPVTAGDQFHLGSNGKAMTATLAAILVDRGKLNWNTTLGQMFPELRKAMSPAYRNVTLEQLLNHRSGFRDENVSEDLLARVLAFTGNGSQARAFFLKDILATPAGTAGEFSYSNVGYTLAAAMMERATGNAYEWLMRKHIFDPLGMTSAGFGPPGRGRLDQPVGHDEGGNPVGIGPGSDGPAAINPAGLMHMSMDDWSKFLRVHLGGVVNGVNLLSAASLAKLHTPDPRPTDFPNGERYGFGWVTVQTEYGPALWHNGSNGFWYSEALLLPQPQQVLPQTHLVPIDFVPI
ncbi:MAG: alpha/beta fold hydrolase, partial [Gemmataceae bacterium]|nr:alpha/beta fold hydrolase [Gemmataceae bacterium]